MPLEECDDEDDSPFPTLEEAEHMVKEKRTRNPQKTEVEQVQTYGMTVYVILIGLYVCSFQVHELSSVDKKNW